MKEVLEQSTQKKQPEHSFSGGSNKPNKEKGKDTEDQSRSRKILPSSGEGGGDDDNSSSSEEELNQRKPWHPKVRRKIKIPTSDNALEQAENREKAMAEWMIKGQLKRGKPITTPKSFSGKVKEDPTSFLENLIIDAKVNS